MKEAFPVKGTLRTHAPLLVVGLLLTGCTTASQMAMLPACPQVSILSDAATVTKYRAGPGRDPTDVMLSAEIGAFKGDCAYDENGAVQMNLTLAIDAQRGPAQTGAPVDLAYFVAVPAFYPKPEAKQVFTIPISFPDNANRVRTVDETLSITIPLDDRKQGPNTQVYLGFQLDPAELEHNRTRGR